MSWNLAKGSCSSEQEITLLERFRKLRQPPEDRFWKLPETFEPDNAKTVYMRKDFLEIWKTMRPRHVEDEEVEFGEDEEYGVDEEAGEDEEYEGDEIEEDMNEVHGAH